MARNALLLFLTLVLLGALFVGYLVVVQDPVLNADVGDRIEKLPIDRAADGQALQLPGIELPSGGGVSFTVYHRETGRPTQRFECEEWTPRTDSKDEVQVVRPRLTMWLPKGLTAAISADEGDLKVEDLEKVQGRPRAGSLTGNVAIVLDRAGGRATTPLSERPQDEIRATLDAVNFDFESGELTSVGPIEITSRDFELAGAGLHLIWNQAENVIQTLTLERGDRLVLHGGGGLLRNAPDQAAAQSATTAPASAPTATKPASPKEPRRKKTEQAYVCVLPANVVAEESKGSVPLAGLEADELRLLFELGGVGEDRTRGPLDPPTKATDAQPQSAPADSPAVPPADATSLVVHWSGALRVEPAPAEPGDQPRRHIEALGRKVTLWQGDDELICSRLEFHEETKQIWLHPDASGRVEFRRGMELAGSANSIYMDQNRKVVKLIGDVQFTSGNASTRKQSIRCSLWGELHLADKAPRSPDAVQSAAPDWMSAGGLQSATFMGAASVDLGQQTLSAERIDVTFAGGVEDGAIESALEKTVASGNVRLEHADESVQSDRLEILFGLTEAGKAYPAFMDALGSVRIRRGGAWLRGDKVLAEMDPGDTEGGPEFVLRKLDVIGHAAMSDPTRKNRLAARGHQIAAEFIGANELQRGIVSGTPEEHALVHGSPYTVRGERVELERDGLHVAGPSWLRFEATRSLQGRQRSRATPVEVTSAESLDVDLSKNTVHLAGDVVVLNGDESLRGDEVTLLLEDAKPTAPVGPRTPGWLNALTPASSQQAIQICYAGGLEFWRTTQKTVASIQHPGRALASASREGGDWLDQRGDVGRAIRKEPQRLVAKNALVKVESLEAGETRPVTHSSIGAPQLEIDMVGRRIETHGETVLGVNNYRLATSAGSQDEQTFGLPSAMITRGPSQTAMTCTQGMTYALGPDGSVRTDSAVFEGNVWFVHAAGRYMVHLEDMLPELQTDPDLLANLKSRNTSLKCDRLECGFLVQGAQPDRAAGPMAARDTRLKWLLASGSANLRDERDLPAKPQSGSKTTERQSLIRTIFARQLDFDLEQKVVRVLGSPSAKARIYEENTDTGEPRTLVGEEFSFDLQDRTVRSGPSRGVIGR